MSPELIRWERLGLHFPVRTLDRPPWMNAFAQAPASLNLGGHTRFYFSTRPAREPDGNFTSRVAWADFDSRETTKLLRISAQPVLSLGSLGDFDEFGTYPFSPVEFRGELLGAYAGWTRLVSVPFDTSIGLSKSIDGTSFNKVGRGPILSASLDEPFVLSGPKLRVFGDHLFMFYIAGQRWIQCSSGIEPVYRIRMATSADGRTWQRFGRDLVPPILDDEAQASPDVFQRGRYFYMIFSYRKGCDFRSGPGAYRLGLARSHNLEWWERLDDRLGFAGETGQWDGEMQSYAHYFVASDGQEYIAYLGNGVGRDGFGLARISNWPKDI